MTRSNLLTLALGLALAPGCGSVTDRADCASSASCPVGERCARTANGSVCWPDAVPPVVGTVTIGCGASGCVRDGELVVTAEATDDAEVFAVEASADLEPARSFPLSRGAGTAWTGTIALGSLPFPALARDVVVTVKAFDGARNVASSPGVGKPVTRVRWAYDLGVPATPPAVESNGDIVVARAAASDQLHIVTPAGAKRGSLTLGAGPVTAPPSIGAEAIWVGANDGKLYAVKPDGSGELAGRTCTASGVAKGPPAVLTTGGVDVAFGAFAGGRIYASGPTCVPTPATLDNDPYVSGPIVDGAGAVYGTTSTIALKALRRHSWDGAAFASNWYVDVGSTGSAPPAFDGLGRILTGGQDGGLDRTTTAGVTAALATLSGSIDESPIVLASGDVVVGDASGKLHRIAPDGAAVWSPPVDLKAAVHAPMALTGGRLLVATADGRLHALDGTGTILWSGPLTAGMALGAGNLHTPAGSPFSTAYYGGADGKLYAVIVEGALDTAAPWPKAWHDARNTSRAGGPF